MNEKKKSTYITEIEESLINSQMISYLIFYEANDIFS